jgi:lipopolysaccharide/colanic/teichoic acid biosynthesis glycosyltransferase
MVDWRIGEHDVLEAGPNDVHGGSPWRRQFEGISGGTCPPGYRPHAGPAAPARLTRRAHAPVRAPELPVTSQHPLGLALKRSLDIVVAAASLVCLSLLIGVVAIAVKIDSRGPVFYRARRVGLGGREFVMLKFRKMRCGIGGPMLTAGDDERVTRLGRFLSKTKIDEIPQLWNVLRGHMSLVGPRPQDPSFVALKWTEYERILKVKPGMTGLYQLAFLRETEVLDVEDHVADYIRRLLPHKTWLEQLYAAHRSILMDLRILAWTAIILTFRIDVAVHRLTGRITMRRRAPALKPSRAKWIARADRRSLRAGRRLWRRPQEASAHDS